MPSPNSVTITAKIGPGNTVTSLVFADVVDLDFQFDEQVIEIAYMKNGTRKTQQFSLTGVTAVTDTVTATLHAFVIS